MINDRVTRHLTIGVSEVEFQALKDEAKRQQITVSTLVKSQVNGLKVRKAGRPKKKIEAQNDDNK